MTQLGEAVSPPEADKPEEKEEEVKSVKIRYSMFFDGTLNNKTNIDARLLAVKSSELTAEERKTAEIMKRGLSDEEMKLAGKVYADNKKVDSFQNGYTNIVKLERYIKTEALDPYDVCIASYVEGPGTTDEDSDDTPGYALGISIPFLTTSGVKRKVKNGLTEVVDKIKEMHKEKDTEIELLTLDTFGFSRGAAGARFFIYQALLDDKSVKQQLQDKGYKVRKVEFKFAGLFDTVSSHGFSFTNDTPALKLDAVSFVKQAVHIAAADEHREKFSLTDIRSAKSNNGIQVYLPGVHSDIGGSYRDNMPDGLKGKEKELNVFYTMGQDSEEKALEEKNRLIESGWFKESEIDLIISKRHRGGARHRQIKEASLYVGREKVSNKYSRIPLHIMADLAKENDIQFESELKTAEKIPGNLKNIDSEINKYFDEHRRSNSSKDFTSQSIDWHDNKRPWLKGLRHGYFHFSAHYSFGLAPRIENGVRTRLVLRG